MHNTFSTSGGPIEKAVFRPPALQVNENRGSDSMQIGEIDRHFYIFVDQAVGNRIHRHISEYRDLFEKYRDSHLVASGKRWKAHSPSSGELCPDMIYIARFRLTVGASMIPAPP